MIAMRRCQCVDESDQQIPAAAATAERERERERKMCGAEQLSGLGAVRGTQYFKMEILEKKTSDYYKPTAR